MNTMTPAQVASNHTARLVAEAARPVYTTDTVSATRREREYQLRWAEEYTHSTDDMYPWCHVCSRPTDHFGEHSDEQLLAFYRARAPRVLR